MVVRLVQEVIDELGGEVMVNTPLPMAGGGVNDGTGLVLVCPRSHAEASRRIGICGVALRAWISDETVLAAWAPMLAIVAGERSARALGFNYPIAQLSTRTAIYWQDTHSRRGCFVLFLPEPSTANKSAWLSQIYKAERYLTGEQSPWDEIGRGPCMGVKEVPSRQVVGGRDLVGCNNSVAWLDQWGLPWCQGHKTLPEKPKTKARRKDSKRR